MDVQRESEYHPVTSFVASFSPQFQHIPNTALFRAIAPMQRRHYPVQNSYVSCLSDLSSFNACAFDVGLHICVHLFSSVEQI